MDTTENKDRTASSISELQRYRFDEGGSWANSRSCSKFACCYTGRVLGTFRSLPTISSMCPRIRIRSRSHSCNTKAPLVTPDCATASSSGFSVPLSCSWFVQFLSSSFQQKSPSQSFELDHPWESYRSSGIHRPDSFRFIFLCKELILRVDCLLIKLAMYHIEIRLVRCAGGSRMMSMRWRTGRERIVERIVLEWRLFATMILGCSQHRIITRNRKFRTEVARFCCISVDKSTLHACLWNILRLTRVISTCKRKHSSSTSNEEDLAK